MLRKQQGECVCVRAHSTPRRTLAQEKGLLFRAGLNPLFLVSDSKFERAGPQKKQMRSLFLPGLVFSWVWFSGWLVSRSVGWLAGQVYFRVWLCEFRACLVVLEAPHTTKTGPKLT